MKFFKYFISQTEGVNEPVPNNDTEEDHYTILHDIEKSVYENFDKNHWVIEAPHDVSNNALRVAYQNNPHLAQLHHLQHKSDEGDRTFKNHNIGIIIHFNIKTRSILLNVSDVNFTKTNLTEKEYTRLTNAILKLYLNYSLLDELLDNLYTDTWKNNSGNSYSNRDASMHIEERKYKDVIILENNYFTYCSAEIDSEYREKLETLYEKVSSMHLLEKKINEELVFLKLGKLPQGKSKNDIMQFLADKNVNSVKKLSADDLTYIKLKLG